MAEYRALLDRRAKQSGVTAQANHLVELIAKVDIELEDPEGSATTACLASSTILLREGVGALLIIVTMLAFLVRAGRRDVVAYVHAGWVWALRAGVVTLGSSHLRSEHQRRKPGVDQRDVFASRSAGPAGGRHLDAPEESGRAMAGESGLQFRRRPVTSVLVRRKCASCEFCYSQPMAPARPHRIAVALVACIAFLSLRLVGDHLHFCFDGSEPLVSVHGDDGRIHHGELGIDAPHQDVNVDLRSAVLKGTVDAVLPLALLGGLLLILPLVRIRRIEFPAVQFSDSRFHHLRPPLRGPPR